MSQLPIDCLNDIFEYLEDDRLTLYSCLLVNHLWCKISVRIFWRNSCKYSTSNVITLTSCFPSESKEILYKNGITILTPITKFPIFNYASFCNVLSFKNIRKKVLDLIKQEIIYSKNRICGCIVIQEICKMFMDQISSLKELLFFDYCRSAHILTLHPKSEYCLKNLSELRCNSSFTCENFRQLSKICHSIVLLYIEHGSPFISDGLGKLISVQKNLKYFKYFGTMLRRSTPIFSKLPNTLIKLEIFGGQVQISYSFLTKLVNLQELEISSSDDKIFEDFANLQLPQLQTLKFINAYPKLELLIKFLEINGKNLKEFHIYNNDNSEILIIIKLCPNLRKIFVRFDNDEIEILKSIFESCKYLVSIKINCGDEFLSEKEALEAFIKYSHSYENISELILFHRDTLTKELLPKELESFLIKWTNCAPQKLLSLVIITENYFEKSLDKNEENMKIIKKYISLGIIKKFKIRNSFDDRI
ncbi:hypothetical protein RhiirA4_464997 [Rhizophagus irregularis]|uniref:F-box domain-containing protein n=1 Tax=Rhizophagus irregularis TaxID=588596 RepID=A0A2I1GRI1_9GLOM|nr:hypothetical protein RhiirA4_464997 [Rhizophagus irregularis]